MSNEWIKISDETVRCQPIGQIYELSDCAGSRKLSYSLEGPVQKEYTHFRVLPGLTQGPKREPTRAELDAEAAKKYSVAKPRPRKVSCLSYEEDAYIAGMEDEREAIWAEWQKVRPVTFGDWLFARCGKTEGGK